MNKTSLAVIGSMVTSFLCVNFLSSIINVSPVSAYTASISTSNNISLDIMPTGDGTNIHSESINIQSTCRSGYNLTIATPESSNLYQYENGTKTSSTASFTPVDGTSALSSNNNTNKWGYTLTSSPTGSTVFSPLSSTVSTLKTSSETASPNSDINDTFNINYGIKVDNSVEPGNYQMDNHGAIVYYLTMDATCTQYTVQFNPNGGTVASGGNNPTQNIQVETLTKLDSKDSLKAPVGGSYTDANNSTITGDSTKLWTFWGWNTAADGTGDWYKDREEVEDLVSAGSTATLYAQWKQATLADLTTSTPVGTEKVINHNEMQDMSPETCYNSDITTAVNAPAATLLDYRGKVITGNNPEQPEQYTVSKLADGLCWMTTNLNLGRSGTDGPNGDGTVTLTSEDTDITSNFVLPASTTTSNTTNTAATIRITNTGGNNNNGTYYSWAAAVADTTSTNTNPTTSICPKNWDLPASNQYSNLNTKSSYSSSNQTTASPSGFLNNGGFTDGATFYQTSYGHLWTSSSSTSSAYGARIENNRILVSLTTGTTYGGNKYYRKNIRCVASQGKVTINYDGNGTVEYPTTGAVATQTNVEISSTVTRTNGFTRTGWVFNGWNTASDGSGIAIAANASIATLNFKPGDTINLYAQWTPQYAITYVNNCMSYASANASCTQTVSNGTSGQKISLNTNGDGSGTLAAYNQWTLTGWKIIGWNTNAGGTGVEYPVSSTYSVTGQNPGDGITLYAHWVPVYTVQYDGNGADNTNGMGTADATTGIKTVAHTNVAEGDTFDLFASNFKKSGYGFVGWSTDVNAWSKLTDNDATNDAKIWGPNEVITAPAYNGTSITTLYAVWAPAEEDANNSPVYLQNWTGCDDMTATTYNSSIDKLNVAKDSITALTDERDGNVYAVAKLVDNNCWMIENLRLDNTSELSIVNTNIDSGDSTLPITNEYDSTNSNYLSASSNSWCTTDSAVCENQSRLNTTNTVADIVPSHIQNITSANAESYFDTTVYSYGNYYNWFSATVGYGTYERRTEEPTGGDLCPAGWKLPYSGGSMGETKGGFNYLEKQMSNYGSSRQKSNRFRMFPNNFIYSGYWQGASVVNRGRYAQYWSSSASIYTTTAGSLYFSSGSSNSLNHADFKYYGLTVRCIKDEGIGEVEEMQEIAGLSASELTSLKSSMTEGKRYRLRDSRDQKVYTVSKLADGRIWMTQNLDLDIDSSTTYNNTNTDIGYNSSTGTYGTASWTPSSSTHTTGTTTWDSTTTEPESYDPGNVYWNGTTSDTSDWETYYGICNNPSDCNETLNPLANYISSSGISQYHLGNYYNWTSAIAMNDSSGVTYGDVGQSICPVGWTLPTAINNAVGSYEYLYTQYGWNSNTYALSNNKYAFQSPMYFTLGGFWMGSMLFTGYGGGFWTPTTDGSSAYYTDVYTDDYQYGTVHPGDAYWRHAGVSVRCVTRR